ncbi:MAG TPA: hypothetical protein VIH99_13160 [Bdellovibrionota bacterium]|jgi:hypothetical protein
MILFVFFFAVPAWAGETVVAKTPAPPSKIECDVLKRDSLRQPTSRLCGSKKWEESVEAYVRRLLPLHFQLAQSNKDPQFAAYVRDESLAGLKKYVEKYRALKKEACEKKKSTVDSFQAPTVSQGTFSELAATMGGYSGVVRGHATWLKESTLKLNSELGKDERRVAAKYPGSAVYSTEEQKKFRNEFYGNWVPYMGLIAPLSAELQNEAGSYENYAKSLDRLKLNAAACDKSINSIR